MFNKRSIKDSLNEKGFTLVELVIVTAILAILTSLNIPIFNGIVRAAEKVVSSLIIKDIKRECMTNINSEMLELAIDVLMKSKNKKLGVFVKIKTPGLFI